MAIDPNSIQLTDEQRALLAKRAEESGRPWDEVLEDFFAELKRPQPTAERNLFEVLDGRGLIGAMEGPGDLSTNPAHLEGLGEPRGGPDPD